MNVLPWTCAETARHLAGYRCGQLDPVLAGQLFDHALGCDRCYRDHWQPFQEDTMFLMGLVLDSLEAEGPRPIQGAENIDGDPAVITWADWSSTADLPLLPTMTTHAAVQLALEPPEATSTMKGPHIRQVGSLLPRVPKRRLIAGYQLYLGDGPPRPEETLRTAAGLVVEADGEDDRVYIEALREGASVDGAALGRCERRELKRSHLIELPGVLLLFQKTRESKKNRMGAGLLRHPGAAWALPEERLTIGRGDDLGLRLPNREVRTNLRFRPEVFQAIADPIERERATNLTLDAIEVSRRHAVLIRSGDGGLELKAESRHPVFVSRERGWVASSEGQASLQIQHGDEMVIGQMLLEYRDGAQA